MPVISFSYADLVGLLGSDPGKEGFAETVPMVGCDVNRLEGDEVELEFFPNRPDLYSVEGIARALKAFLGLRPGMPKYDVNDSNIEMELDESVLPVRPFVVCGIVRDLRLTDATVRSLMDMQEKLHVTVGRNRKKVSVGIHDLDRVRPPFVYKAVPPASVRFVPLASSEEMDLREILQRHEKGMAFAPLLDRMDLFPIILDREGSVLSFPPIINGVLTQVTRDTRNLFLDVTGTDYAAVNLTLNILSTALAERGCRLESVVMRYPRRAPFRTPSLLSKKRSMDPATANRLLGTELSINDMMDSLGRMMYDARLVDSRIEVGIPAFRADILHEVDLVEDIAIGFGYRRLTGELPRAMTFGRELASEFRAERARQAMTGLGFNEMMSFALTSPGKQFVAMGAAASGASELLHPVTEDQTILRTSLSPSLLELLRINKHYDLPQRLFEVGDVVVEHRNRRHLAAVFIHPRANFTEAKALAEAVLRELGLEGRYMIKPHDRPEFIKGRCASVILDERPPPKSGGLLSDDRPPANAGGLHPRQIAKQFGESSTEGRTEIGAASLPPPKGGGLLSDEKARPVGWFGEYHPQVIVNFELAHPVGGFELELDGL
jgi:phenylalanyl-tRNA synthetase beta chain